MENRVVITGCGVIRSLGQDVSTFWENLVAGKSGISKVDMMITHTSSVAHRREGGVATMPVERCQRDGKPGYRWGKTGYC